MKKTGTGMWISFPGKKEIQILAQIHVCLWDGIAYGASMWCQRHLKDNLNTCQSRSPE